MKRMKWILVMTAFFGTFLAHAQRDPEAVVDPLTVKSGVIELKQTYGFSAGGVRTRLLLANTQLGPIAVLEELAPVVDRLPTTPKVGGARVNRVYFLQEDILKRDCGSRVFTSLRSTDDGQLVALTIEDNRARFCRDLPPLVSVEEKDLKEGGPYSKSFVAGKLDN